MMCRANSPGRSPRLCLGGAGSPKCLAIALAVAAVMRRLGLFHGPVQRKAPIMGIERPIKLVVFGASGATGQWLVRLAVERGHQVTAVMREGASASVPQGVDVVRGDPLEGAFVDMAVTGKDAVVTALGLRYGRGNNPFSSLASPPTLLSQSAAHMLAAMKRHGVSRISMVSAAGVG